ncbi:MAG TPA: AAA-associated domain-containing protein [Stellaceae bacterium]|nr:AAA-associated domain-containing protein [Stellaceae bacterium]
MSAGAAQLSDLIPMCSRLPPASVDQLVGATRLISRSGGRMAHGKLAKALHFSDEHTVGAVEFLSRLGLVEATGVDIALTEVGKRIASSRIPARRRLFAELATRLPLIHEIMDVLAKQPGRSMSRDELLESLGAQSCAPDAGRLFDHLVAWGRYAGLFSYDADTGDVSLH